MKLEKIFDINHKGAAEPVYFSDANVLGCSGSVGNHYAFYDTNTGKLIKKFKLGKSCYVLTSLQTSQKILLRGSGDEYVIVGYKQSELIEVVFSEGLFISDFRTSVTFDDQYFLLNERALSEQQSCKTCLIDSLDGTVKESEIDSVVSSIAFYKYRYNNSAAGEPLFLFDYTCNPKTGQILYEKTLVDWWAPAVSQNRKYGKKPKCIVDASENSYACLSAVKDRHYEFQIRDWQHHIIKTISMDVSEMANYEDIDARFNDLDYYDDGENQSLLLRSWNNRKDENNENIYDAGIFFYDVKKEVTIYQKVIHARVFVNYFSSQLLLFHEIISNNYPPEYKTTVFSLKHGIVFEDELIDSSPVRGVQDDVIILAKEEYKGLVGYKVVPS